jgi:GTP-binding protein YchF
MDLGIVGLARSGKTTLFDALTRGHAHTSGFGSLEPSIGVVKVPDERLDKLSTLLRAKKVTHLEVRFLDFPGSLSLRGEATPAAYIASLAQCDALVHVVRAFYDESVPHPEGSVDPDRDIAAVNLELAFGDLAALERRHSKIEIEVRSARAGERDAGERELVLLGRLRDALEREEPLRAQELSAEERRLISGYQLLTIKPLVIVLNVDEHDAARSNEVAEEYSRKYGGRGVEIVAVCAKLERELMELAEDEATEFRRDLGIEAGAIDRVVGRSQEALGLITFFTVGEPEGRAWAVAAGTPALEAAGKIHSDIARGFIRAEVITWSDLLDAASYAEARKRGLQRTEGKQYIVQEGDVLHVLFNV